jgi:NADH dehydrogenase
VADFMVQSLDRPETIGKTLALGGVDSLPWKDLIQTVGLALNQRKFRIPVPDWAIRLPALLLDRFSWFPITRIELAMFLEGNGCDSTELYRSFGFTPRRFTPENLKYLLETDTR